LSRTVTAGAAFRLLTRIGSGGCIRLRHFDNHFSMGILDALCFQSFGDSLESFPADNN